MNAIPENPKPNRKIYFFVGLSSLIWGIIVIPVMMQLFWGFSFDIASCFLGLIVAFLLSVFPLSFGERWPPKDKEYQVLLYPVIMIPLSILGTTIKYVWLW